MAQARNIRMGAASPVCRKIKSMNDSYLAGIGSKRGKGA